MILWYNILLEEYLNYENQKIKSTIKKILENQKTKNKIHYQKNT